MERIFKAIRILSEKGIEQLTYDDICYVHHIELSEQNVKELQRLGYKVEIIKRDGWVNKFEISWM